VAVWKFAGGEEGDAERDRRAVVDDGPHPGGVLFLAFFDRRGLRRLVGHG
jgi:hypothetical protein